MGVEQSYAGGMLMRYEREIPPLSRVTLAVLPIDWPWGRGLHDELAKATNEARVMHAFRNIFEILTKT